MAKADDTPMVYLRNATWQEVNVEVRRGIEKACANNAAFETKKMALGEQWEIPAPDVDVCYRRDRDPDHPNGQWAPWNTIVDSEPKPLYRDIT